MGKNRRFVAISLLMLIPVFLSGQTEKVIVDFCTGETIRLVRSDSTESWSLKPETASDKDKRDQKMSQEANPVLRDTADSGGHASAGSSRPDSPDSTRPTSVPDSTGQTSSSDSTRPTSSSDSTRPIPRSDRFRIVENTAFSVGEHLEFVIAWGVVKAGIATMSVIDTVEIFGRPSYRIETTAHSSSFFDRMYKVRDRVESLMDIGGLFSWKFEKHLREGKYKADRYAIFDQLNERVINKNDTVQAPLYVQDILASFYYFRTQPLKVGTHFDIENYSDGKVYPLRVIVHRKETIKVPAGKFDCIVVEPVLREEGLFKAKGKLTIWLTDDKRRMPVLMKSKILVGSIDARLKSYGYR